MTEWLTAIIYDILHSGLEPSSFVHPKPADGFRAFHTHLNIHTSMELLSLPDSVCFVPFFSLLISLFAFLTHWLPGFFMEGTTH